MNKICQKTTTRAKRRHHALRIVQRRLFIARNLLSSPPYTYSPVPGRLRKWNFSCNCYLCKGDKKPGLETLKEKRVRLNEKDWHATADSSPPRTGMTASTGAARGRSSPATSSAGNLPGNASIRISPIQSASCPGAISVVPLKAV